MKKNHKIDKRIHPWRDNLAAVYLRDVVDVPHYTKGKDYAVKVSHTALRRLPEARASLDSEILYGEIMTVYDREGEWAWGQHNYDNYVGYVLMKDLGEPFPTTHMVHIMWSFIFQHPDVKSLPVMPLSMGSCVCVLDVQGNFSKVAEGWIYTNHLVPKDYLVDDFVSIAENFLHVPYIFGGRTSFGLDCSALIQTALKRVGVDAPRDCDMQRMLGESVTDDSRERGDLIFWESHVGVLQDSHLFLHANATFMQTVSENFDQACIRITQTEGDIQDMRRLGSKKL